MSNIKVDLIRIDQEADVVVAALAALFRDDARRAPIQPDLVDGCKLVRANLGAGPSTYDGLVVQGRRTTTSTTVSGADLLIFRYHFLRAMEGIFPVRLARTSIFESEDFIYLVAGGVEISARNTPSGRCERLTSLTKERVASGERVGTILNQFVTDNRVSVADSESIKILRQLSRTCGNPGDELRHILIEVFDNGCFALLPFPGFYLFALNGPGKTLPVNPKGPTSVEAMIISNALHACEGDERVSAQGRSRLLSYFGDPA